MIIQKFKLTTVALLASSALYSAQSQAIDFVTNTVVNHQQMEKRVRKDASTPANESYLFALNGHDMSFQSFPAATAGGKIAIQIYELALIDSSGRDVGVPDGEIRGLFNSFSNQDVIHLRWMDGASQFVRLNLGHIADSSKFGFFAIPIGTPFTTVSLELAELGTSAELTDFAIKLYSLPGVPANSGDLSIGWRWKIWFERKLHSWEEDAGPTADWFVAPLPKKVNLCGIRDSGWGGGDAIDSSTVRQLAFADMPQDTPSLFDVYSNSPTSTVDFKLASASVTSATGGLDDSTLSLKYEDPSLGTIDFSAGQEKTVNAGTDIQIYGSTSLNSYEFDSGNVSASFDIEVKCN